MSELHLDLCGLKCPMPALRTAKALRAMWPGQVLVVTCTDPLAAIDIPNLVRERGDTLLDQASTAATVTFRIARRPDPE